MVGFSCEAKDAATLEFMSRVGREVRAPLSNMTMPLFAAEDGRGWLCATGVLLRVLDTHFILTAAHVFDGWKTRPIPLSVTDGVIGNGTFPLGDVTLRRSPTKNPGDRLADDPFDTCVCDISQETAERIVAGGRFRFLSLDEVDPWDKQDLRSWYTVFGFPGELNQKEVAPKTLASNACSYATFLYAGERGGIRWTEADKGGGILMDYGPNTTQNDDGQLVKPPDPTGMSGGGMWRVAEAGSSKGDWNAASLKLIGIQSAVYEKKHVLRGTRVVYSLGMIYRAHESLRPEFEAHFGQDACRRHLG